MISTDFEFIMIRHLLSQITAEPIIILVAISWTIVDGAQIQTNLLLWKICHLQLNYSEEVCSNLTLDENESINIEVQARANSFLMIQEYLMYSLAFVWCLFYGKLYDRYKNLRISNFASHFIKVS